MKDKMLNTLTRLVLCPGSKATDEACKVCPYKGLFDCAAQLRRASYATLIESVETSKQNLEMRITDVLHELGMPGHIKGYSYARYAISLVVERPQLIDYITGELYPLVAEKFDTTPSRVERAIRHGIEVAWDRGDIETIQKWFGYTVSLTKGKPTNSEFIALLSDRLRLEMKETEL